MTEFLFYHISKRTALDALSALLNKTLSRNKKAKVKCENVEKIHFLDHGLWAFEKNLFLPHGGKFTPAPEKQPVYISDDDDNPAEAEFLFLHGDTPAPADTENYERVIYLFEDHDEPAKISARAAYTKYKNAGKNVTYHPDV